MAPVLLLVAIYLAFVSLGLPDGVFGVAWPAMRADFGAPLEAAGAVSLLGGACGAASSLASGRILGRFGTPRVVLVSCAMTGLGLAGFSLAPAYGALLWLAVPLGWGGGAVDSGLNHYVARHYSSRHMNWLHCSWGIGATLGPMIVASRMAAGSGWRSGYAILSLVQLGLATVFAATLRLWTRDDPPPKGAADGGSRPRSRLAETAPWFGVVSFAAYAGVEFAVGLWAASLLVESRGLPLKTAAVWVGMYYASITVGRFATGLVSDRVGNRSLVRLGLVLAAAGGLLLSTRSMSGAALAGLLFLGLGLAPVYPCLMHETPRRFEPELARSVIGFQVGAAYVGGPILPALVGLIAARWGLEAVPACILTLVVLVVASTEALNALTARSA